MGKRRHRQRLGFVLLVALTLSACGDAPPSPPLEVEVAGCTSVRPGPICVVDGEGQLQLWLPVSPAAAVTLNAGANIVEQAAVQGGQRLIVQVGKDLRRLQLSSHDAGAPRASSRASWSLALRHRAAPPWWLQTQQLLARGEVAAAEDFLRSQMSDNPSLEDHGERLFRLAGLVYRRGETAEARRLLRRAMEEYRAAERPLELIRSGTALSFWLHADNLWGEERQLLASLETVTGATAEGDLLRHFFQGQLALETGDLRTAHKRLQAAVQQAERLGLDRFRHQGEQLLARALMRAGRQDDAAGIFERLANDPTGLASPCEQALFFNNLGWSRLLQLEGGQQAEAVAPLRRAVDLLQRCPDHQDELANIVTNLALASLHGGQTADSRRHLQRARRLQPRPQLRIQLWWLEIEARLALSARQHQAALGLFAEEAQLAKEALVPRAHWRAELGIARTLWGLGRRGEALAAFQRAEEILDSESLSVPVGVDRAAFVAQRQWASSLYLETLLLSQQPGEAMRAARRARSRVLRSLWRGQRLAHLSPSERRRWDSTLSRYQAVRSALDRNLQATWELPGDRLAAAAERRRELRASLREILDTALEVLASPSSSGYALRPPQHGEAVLLFHPGTDGWLGFLEGSEGVVAKALGHVDSEASPDQLAAHLLEPFAAPLRRSTTLRILPYGELRDIDFHALPFDDEPLIVRQPVVYGLDLPADAPTVPAIDAALMVIDPGRDLPHTRREKAALRGALERQRVTRVHWLEGLDAEVEAVRRLLPAVDLFHFAGHGLFDGWDSALGLADDSRLSVDDIFALSRVPARVVLSGCETGRSGTPDLHGLEDASGIGAAFLTAGSREVIATQRPVDDHLAAALMSNLYPAMADGHGAAEALRQAQVSHWRRKPSSDWASFRAIVP